MAASGQSRHLERLTGVKRTTYASNPLATGYAEIAQNSFADALMRGAREASVLM